MADFLSSYFDSFDSKNGGYDEKVLSQNLAILNAEQPVSVLDMAQLESPRVPARIRELDKLDDKALENQIDSNATEDVDMEIPVASMTMFEQGAKSLFSVKLGASKDQDLNREKKHSSTFYRRQNELIQEPDLEYDECSPVSAARLREAQRVPRRQLTVDVGVDLNEHRRMLLKEKERQRQQQEAEASDEMYQEILKCEERVAAEVARREGFKGTIMRFLWKKQKYKANRKK